jgi:branched-chain amino acid transport system ATP-binding protein
MAPILEVTGLSKRFGGLTAVDNFNLRVDKGEMIGLIGPNGAGKTTFFNIVTGLLKPDSGTVFFEGKDITRLKPHKIANMGIARTFQNTQSFRRMLVIENVGVANFSERARSRANGGGDHLSKSLEALRRVKLVPPEENIFKLASQLSHGMSKRLDIARVLVLEPDLLLLDEPFGGLGTIEMGVMSSLIEGLHREGLTIVIIEHKMRALARLVKKLVVMHFGENIAEGVPSKIAMNPRVCEAYLGKGGGGLIA